MTRHKAQSRVIVALDVSEVGKAQMLVSSLQGKVGGFKVGFEFIYSMFTALMMLEFEDSVSLLCSLRKLIQSFNGGEFVDCKLADIPNTVSGAVKAICGLQPLMLNMHAFAGHEAMKAARAAIDQMTYSLNIERKPLLLAVTLLTSIGEQDLVELGMKSEENKEPRRLEFVVRYAKLAQSCGCDGVIASPLEVSAIRVACGPNFKIFTPGVRMPGSNNQDQKAVATPGESIRDGADGVIVGRDITGAKDPAVAAALVINNILETVGEEN